MSLTTEQKLYLNNNTASIQNSFNTYCIQHNYMAVYFTDSVNKPFITFGSTNNFSTIITFGRRQANLACVFNCSENFTTQFNTFTT